MARQAKERKGDDGASGDFTAELITSLNKENGSRIAYNLAEDESPTHVKRWVSTGSTLLDYIVANRRSGGLPEGRIVEIFGPPSIGKSHIATQIARSTQQMGGICVYIDTENATSVENLQALGVDVTRRFVYVDTHCTEEVFDVAEKTILKAKAMQRDVPITIIWDSVAASSPKAELLGDYDKDSIGLQARAISKGMRKITGVIGDQSVLMVCLNQTRTKIGVMHGDPTTVPGGMAIPFHASVRLKLGAGQQIQNKNGDVVGIHVSAKTVKNKVSPPFRTANFQIHFGKGIIEHEEIFDELRDAGERQVGKHIICVSGDGAWKVFTVTDVERGVTVIEKKFHKAEFGELLSHPEYKTFLDDLIEAVMVRTRNDSDLTDAAAEDNE
jgi:recombination protein RecA